MLIQKITHTQIKQSAFASLHHQNKCQNTGICTIKNLPFEGGFLFLVY